MFRHQKNSKIGREKGKINCLNRHQKRHLLRERWCVLGVFGGERGVLGCVLGVF